MAAAGEVGDVAEGEVVDLGASGHGEEGDDVGAGCGVRGGEGEVSADDGDEGGEGDEGVEVPVRGAAVGGLGFALPVEVHSARASRPPTIRARAGSAGRL